MELLLTLEEFCGEEGVFEQPEADNSTSTSAGGAVFAPLFANLLQLLYDGEVVEEAAITSWAAEKEHADETEKVFLSKVSGRQSLYVVAFASPTHLLFQQLVKAIEPCTTLRRCCICHLIIRQ